jgi:hypothetical protein
MDMSTEYKIKNPNTGYRYVNWLLAPVPSVPPKQIDIDREYISNWVLRSRHARETLNIKRHVGESDDWPHYPKARNHGLLGISGWSCDLTIPNETTKEELIAEVTQGVIGYETQRRGGRVQWSASEEIYIEQAGHNGGYPSNNGITRLHPYISVYDCVIFFPDTVTKEELIENTTEIAATWGPKAHVVWSATETIWPKLPQKDAS